MPSCPKCGKKFSTLQALNDHFRSVHPNEKFVPPKQPSGMRTFLVVIVIVILVVGGAVGYLVYSGSNHKTTSSTNSPCTSCIGEAVPAALNQNLTGVSSSTLAAIGIGSGVTKPTSVSGSSLLNDGKPTFLYIGADYCPYCAAERWAMIIALSKFGTFSNVTLMLSSASDIYPNTATFSFFNSNYSSPYITFIGIEYENRGETTQTTIPSAYSQLESQYDSAGSIPFVDIDNQYSIVGSQYVPDILRVGDSSSGAPLNWTQIASQLNDPNSAVAKAIDGTANTLISAICKVTAGNPTSVCSQSFAQISLTLVPSPFSGHQTLAVASVSPNRLEDFTF